MHDKDTLLHYQALRILNSVSEFEPELDSYNTIDAQYNGIGEMVNPVESLKFQRLERLRICGRRFLPRMRIYDLTGGASRTIIHALPGP